MPKFAQRTALMILLALLNLAVPAHAKRVALVIGNAQYQNEKSLRNPVNDAKLIAEVLRNDLKFDDVMLRKNLGRRELGRAISELADKARGADAVVVYYSGHGMQRGGQNYLLPVDAAIQQESDIDIEGVAATRLLAELENAGAKVTVVVLDACRDNPYSSRAKSGAKGLARLGDVGEGMLVAYATRDGSTADDGAGRNSPYAIALARQLKRTDQTVRLAFEQVADDVKSATNNKQKPVTYGDLKSSVFLTDFSNVARLNVTPPANNRTAAGSTFHDCADCPEMVVIPTANGIAGFSLGQSEVTQGQWQAVMGNNPNYNQGYFAECGVNCPVENVSWDDAQQFIGKLNARTGKAYRLPTEQEWEYACLANQKTEYCGGNDLEAVGWNMYNSGNKTHQAKGKQANAFGLYDMSGNVWEWTDSCWEGDCARRVVRGGSWNESPQFVRAAFRSRGATAYRVFYYGFRLARTAP